MNDEKKLEIHIDYLSFTFPVYVEYSIDDSMSKIKQRICEILHFMPDEYSQVFTPKNSYSKEYRLGQHVTIRYGGVTTRMKVKVGETEEGDAIYDMFETCQFELKGQGCREVEFRNEGKFDYLKLINFFTIELKGKCRRLDIAIDDLYGQSISIDKVISLIKKGDYVSSRFRSAPKIETCVDGGKSIWFGWSRKATMELMIYDKKAERLYHKDPYDGNYWVRYELRFLKERADACAFFIYDKKFDDLGDFAAQELFNTLELKKRGNDSNPSRWPTLPSWVNFLNVCKKTHFTQLPKLELTIEKKVQWRDFSLTRQNIQLDMAEVYDDDFENYVDPAIGKILHELKMQLEYLEQEKFDENNLPLINNYLKTKYGVDYPLKTKDDIQLYVDDLKRRIKYFDSDKFKLPF